VILTVEDFMLETDSVSLMQRTLASILQISNLKALICALNHNSEARVSGTVCAMSLLGLGSVQGLCTEQRLLWKADFWKVLWSDDFSWCCLSFIVFASGPSQPEPGRDVADVASGVENTAYHGLALRPLPSSCVSQTVKVTCLEYE